MTRRPIRGLAPVTVSEPAPRPPGPPTILGPDGRTWTRAGDGLYYDERRTEVFSQAALRDLIDRAAERLLRDLARTEDPTLRAVADARTDDELRALWDSTPRHLRTRTHILGRRAVLKLPPKERA